MTDVNVLLTDSAPDTQDQILAGPLSGGLCPTYAKAQEIAEKHGGSWVEWEPYRCTFEFASSLGAQNFVREVYKEIPKGIAFSA